MRISRVILILLIVGFISQFVYYYPNLPETIASHYNAAGEADGWMSKQSFIIAEGIILLFIVLEFTLLPSLIEKMPASTLNLPNKEYWLMPERRAELFGKMRIYFEWFAAALLALFIAVNQLVFRANLNKENLSSPAMLTILGIFLAFTIIWLIALTKSFYKVDGK